MHIYLAATFNHVRAIQTWASDREAKLTLDMRNFQLEVKHRGRYFTLLPMFQARVDGHWLHTTALPLEAVGFGGWRPYAPIKHPHSTEKLMFKSFLVQRGLATPRQCSLDGGAAPEMDYLVKADVGSFGKQIFGPYRAGELAALPPSTSASSEPTRYFAEEFIVGTTCKVWFWGARPFFAHAHPFPRVAGTGADRLETLLEKRLANCLLDWNAFTDRDTVLSCLRFQGVNLGEVLERGRTVFIDYRYSQRYEPTLGVTATSDNALPAVVERTGDQVALMGRAVAALLQTTIPAPILVSVDAILDDAGDLHWLEMNTNSLMPPEGYSVMFSDLFD